MSASEKRPLVGVAVLLMRHVPTGNIARREVLFMLRKGSHGAGTWGLPGGHIEYNERAVDAASREVCEELGIEIPSADFARDGWSESFFEVEQKHYLTVFCKTSVTSGLTLLTAEPRIMEPEKCAELRWASLNDPPVPLFSPLADYLRRAL